jgi:hypothetical protein
MQWWATKIITTLSKLSYVERLKSWGLTILKFRRIRGDFIEVYKIVSGKYVCTAPLFKFSNFQGTRGNDYKTETTRTHFDLRKYYFTNRIVNIWNSLPNDIVKACMTNQFKNKLDKFW